MGENSDPQMGSVPLDAHDIGSESEALIGNISHHRVEIDSSPPFGSVKEAVTHFGGSGSWKPPLHLLREAQVAELEKYLIMKEQETLDVLKELELTKGVIDGLKVKLQMEASQCRAAPELNSDETPAVEERNKVTPGNLVIDNEKLSSESFTVELNQAKLNFSRTSDDLTAIRASVEDLCKKLKKGNIMIERSSYPEEEDNPISINQQMADNAETKVGSKVPADLILELRQFNIESDKFKKMAEAAKTEVFKAVSEVEEIKSSIRMAEMRWVAARKMEEAAKAAEAVALAELKALSNTESSSGVPLRKHFSFKEQTQNVEKKPKNRIVKSVHQFNRRQASKLAIPESLEETTDIRLSRVPIEEVLNRVKMVNRRKVVAEELLQRLNLEPGQKRQSFCNPLQHRRDSHLLGMNNSYPTNDEPKQPVLRSTKSIDDLLSGKLMPEPLVMETHAEYDMDRERMSLGQMLHKQGRVLLPACTEKDACDLKQMFAKNKKLRFFPLAMQLIKEKKVKT
ncbi:WEB family [Dillenia turbinata]|uniref:WEB family n=1 Tax=Dillenia turbinata TaxID=194707 RepID=A0AAN8VL27_9MAGN